MYLALKGHVWLRVSLELAPLLAVFLHPLLHLLHVLQYLLVSAHLLQHSLASRHKRNLPLLGKYLLVDSCGCLAFFQPNHLHQSMQLLLFLGSDAWFEHSSFHRVRDKVLGWGWECNHLQQVVVGHVSWEPECAGHSL